MMANILSLTSHVVYGHVGGQASVPAWHAMGHEVWHIPTVLFSNHPGHGGFGGAPVDLALQNQLLDGLSERQFLANCNAVHTGYLGQPGSADVALRAIDTTDAVVICDPILGDDGRLFVPEEIATVLRDQLLPRSAIVTPNLFELSWLTGLDLPSINDAILACEALRQLGPEWVICTSAWQFEEWLHNIAVGPHGAVQVRVPFFPDKNVVPKGTGDAFTAILLGHYLDYGDIPAALSWASAALHGLIQGSINRYADELAVISDRDQITSPNRIFPVERLG